MTLIRRAQKSSPFRDTIVTDIESNPSVSFSTTRSSTPSYTTKAEWSLRISAWISRQWRRIPRKWRTKTIDANGKVYYGGIPARRLLIFFTVSTVVMAVWSTIHFAPPGRNYLDPNYWRRSHSLSSQQLYDLRNRFPIRIDTNSSDEMESIAHPGALLADKERMKSLFGKMKIENMTVPKFWDPVDAFGKYDGGVREFLGNRGRYLITPTEASAIGSFYDEKQTIFLAIASYRDPECYPTVESAFARARYPERLRIAIVDQQMEGQNDTSCQPPSETLCRTSPNNTLCAYIGQIDYIEYPSTLMVGPVFARHLANRMYRGEYFAMQVDSHVRFVANWDEDIIDQWTSAENEMAVISTYMTDIGKHNIDNVTHESRVFQRSIMCDFEYEWTGLMTHIKFNKQPNHIPKVKDSPMLHPFWAAGFSFGRGHFLVSVPYDHYLPFVFQGEEILQTIRGFTFGYDFYAPSRNVAFHIYATRTNREKRKNVPKFTENEVVFGSEAKRQAYLRLIGISGTSDPALDYFNLEEDKYGLGRIRSREKFFETFGIHPSNRTIEGGLCEFVKGYPNPDISMNAFFKKVLRYDNMGIDYSRIFYHHRTPERRVTTIDEEELASLQLRLQEMLANRTNTTDS